MAHLRRTDILRALEALAGEIPATSPPLQLLLVGGAAMVLLYDARETTKDVDAVPLGSAEAEALRAAALKVAGRLQLPEDWLNDGAKGYVHGLVLGSVLLNRPRLVVSTPAPQQLLAMKLCAWRDDVDIGDARLLLSKVPGDRLQVWKLVEPHLVPGRELKAQYAFADLWEAERGSP